MNISLPHSWLLDHLDTSATPRDIQTHVSLCGPAIEHIRELDGETMYDIEVTTNRVDVMSVRGFAREAAVILDNAGIKSRLKPLITQSFESEHMAVIPKIEDPEHLCNRILAVVVSVDPKSPTPDWMQKRLQLVDQASKGISLAIDMTNYVTADLGHPCHVFDYDKILALGNMIRVQTAKPGMTFVDLHGTTFTTVGGEVVFVNQKNEIIDLPGVIGTLNSAVDKNTKRVLFWIESIAPEKIRHASMSHAIRTQAAELNERLIDPNLATGVFAHGIELLVRHANGHVVSKTIDLFPNQKDNLPKPITLSSAEVVRYLGVNLPEKTVTKIFEQLECDIEVKKSAKDAYELAVTPPTFRTDLTIPADLIEEVARIYGYHNLPSTLMETAIPTTYPENTHFALEDSTATFLTGRGYQELLTYSLISESLAEQEGGEHLVLKNPLTDDRAVLRQHLLPSHAEALAKQYKPELLRGSFEFANVYLPQKNDLPQEKLTLTVLDSDIRSLRATVDALFRFWNLHGFTVKASPDEENAKIDGRINTIWDSFGFITHGERVLGIIGYLKDGFVGCEIDWQAMLSLRRSWPEYHSIPKTAPYFEDWTLVVPAQTPLGEIADALKSADPRITAAELISQYQDRVTFHITFLDPAQQLDGENVREIKERAKKQLQSRKVNMYGE